MKNTIMDRCAERQAQIVRRRDELCARYPALWSKIVAEWDSPGLDERAWLMYSANYLFRTGNVRWAIDPLTLNWRLKAAPNVSAARDLKSLSFVLLTHRHADHLELSLLSALRQRPAIKWQLSKKCTGCQTIVQLITAFCWANSSLSYRKNWSPRLESNEPAMVRLAK